MTNITMLVTAVIAIVYTLAFFFIVSVLNNYKEKET